MEPRPCRVCVRVRACVRVCVLTQSCPTVGDLRDSAGAISEHGALSRQPARSAVAAVCFRGSPSEE